MPAVSIIVPVYKVEQYLPRCIESILSQSFTDFELLLIDDGSPDDSGRICDVYAAKDNRIRVFHKENGGASSARNVGLNNAGGAWISFIDSDDYVSADMLMRALELQSETKADIVEFGIKTVYEYIPPEPLTGQSVIQSFPGIEMISRIYLDCLGGSVYPVNKIYKSSIFDGLRFEENRENEDTIIAPQEYFRADLVTVTDEVLYFYFIGSSSVSRSPFSLKKLDVLHAFESNRSFYLQKGLVRETELVDATYAFILKKYIYKIEAKYGRDCEAWQTTVNRYFELFPKFRKNKEINVRQKIVLFLFYVKIRVANKCEVLHCRRK